MPAQNQPRNAVTRISDRPTAVSSTAAASPSAVTCGGFTDMLIPAGPSRNASSLIPDRYHTPNRESSQSERKPLSPKRKAAKFHKRRTRTEDTAGGQAKQESQA